MPASLTKLEQAVKRAHTAYEKAERAHRQQQHAAAADTGDAPVDDEPGDDITEAA